MNCGHVYVWLPDPSNPLGGRVIRDHVPLLYLDTDGEGKGRLWGRYVRVRNAGTLSEPDATSGGIRPVPIGNAQPNSDGDFLFEPGRGGGRIDKVVFVGVSSFPAELLESGVPFPEPEFRWRYIQASHFGEVNTYYHLNRIANYVNELLQKLGAPSLPAVIAVVNAHNAATESEGNRDGVRRGERWLPFQGGHYRLPGRRSNPIECEPIAPHGEIHLGPGWRLTEYGALVEAAGGRYRANASHNAGILYHEYGHHITRHTADFRANAVRRPDDQNNRKTATDEGTCDYWAAVMLDTPHIWAWHHRHDDQVVHPRSLISSKTMKDYDPDPKADPHLNGTIWAATLWDLRIRLTAASPERGKQADLLLLKALLLIGGLMGDISPPTVKSVRQAREGFATGLSALLEADALLYSGSHHKLILDTFARRGIHPGPILGQIQPMKTGAAFRFLGRSRLALLESSLGMGGLSKHVPPEEIPETEDLLSAASLDAHFRMLGKPRLSFIAVGDIMLGGRAKKVLAKHGSDYPFQAVLPLLSRAPIVLGNLEGPLAREAKKQDRTYSYRVHPRLATSLLRAGINVVTLANNHILDCGRAGVLETLEALTRTGIALVGAGINKGKAHSPAILGAGALRVGFLGYYWNRRTAASEKLAGSAMDSFEELRADISALRNDVDRIVVTFHWGVPYLREPSAADRAKARFAVDCGADAVIGHHPHIIQPFEVYRGCPIFFSIGNFVFGSGNSQGEGLIVGLRFEEDCTTVEVYPLYVKNRDPRVNYQPKILSAKGGARTLSKLVGISAADGLLLRIGDIGGLLSLQRRSA